MKSKKAEPNAKVKIKNLKPTQKPIQDISKQDAEAVKGGGREDVNSEVWRKGG